MDFTATQPGFHQALRLAARAVPSRGGLPMLQAVVLDAQSGHLTLRATDLELGISTTLPANVTVPGRAAVPARVLGEYVANLPSGPLRMVLDSDTNRLRLVCGRFDAALATLDPAEFPTFPDLPATGTTNAAAAGLSLELDAKTLRQAIDRVAFAAARDGKHPVLAAILFAFGPDGLTLAAADSFRLARVHLAQVSTPARQVLVPVHAVTEFARLLPAAEAARLDLTADGKGLHLSVESASTVLYTRLVEGRYPDIDRLVPQEWSTRVTVEAADLRRAVRVAGLFGGGSEGRPVLLKAQPGWLRLRARGDDLGDALSELPAALEGEPQTVALNAPLLAEVLDAAGGAQLEFSWVGPQAPVTVREVVSEGDSPWRGREQAIDLWLIMPLSDPALTRRVDQTDDQAA